MKRRRKPALWPVLLCLALPGGCGGGGGGANPAATTSTGVAATLERYFDALRRGDTDGVRAVLAPDYRFDRGLAFLDPAQPFEGFFSLRYQALHSRIETLTTSGKTAIATVGTTFAGTLNLTILDLGHPQVNGSGHLAIELEQRGGEWRLTAIRPVRRTYVSPAAALAATTLSGFRVNGQTSAEVPPGAPLVLTGIANRTELLIAVIGGAVSIEDLPYRPGVEWRVELQAPDEPGRYLAHVLAINCNTNCFSTTTVNRFLDGDHISLPVTVTNGP